MRRTTSGPPRSLAAGPQGLLALDEALAELADANCVVTIAAVIAERVRLQPDMVARALDARVR